MLLTFVAVSIIGVAERAVAGGYETGVGFAGCGWRRWGYVNF